MSPDLAAHVERERARVTKDVWLTVMRRDGWRCRYCRRALESRSRWARWRGRQPEVDHDVPVSRTDVRRYRQGGVARDYRHGGTSDLHNLQALCRRCNRSKGALTGQEFVRRRRWRRVRAVARAWPVWAVLAAWVVWPDATGRVAADLWRAFAPIIDAALEAL